MKRRIRNTLLFLLSLLFAQQAISLMGSTIFKNQQEIIVREEIDPSVFFYTESEQALKAEKEVRRRTNGDRKD